MELDGKPNQVSVQTSTSKSDFTKVKLLGKGGFAKCYQLKETLTNKLFAGKVINKSICRDLNYKEMIEREIKIHSGLKHKNIVNFHRSFKDSKHVYLILELCNRGTLYDMLKRRKTISECEIRYFVKQIASACDYIHSKNVIHRDLKLNNLLLTDDVVLKVADFGLSIQLQNENELRHSCIGTMFYSAPEIGKSGYDNKVDVFSLGCCVYALAVGHPPFEQLDSGLFESLLCSLTDLPSCFKANSSYTFSADISSELKLFILKLLNKNPAERPTMANILNDSFMTYYMPSSLPVSCLIEPLITTSNHLLPIASMPLTVNRNVQNLHLPLITRNQKRSSTEIQQQKIELLKRKRLRLIEKVPVITLEDDEIKPTRKAAKKKAKKPTKKESKKTKKPIKNKNAKIPLIILRD